MRKSPYTLTYSDLVQWAEKQEGYARERKVKAMGNGVTNLEALTRDEECAKKVTAMFRKCQPGQQADLFALFNEMR